MLSSRSAKIPTLSPPHWKRRASKLAPVRISGTDIALVAVLAVGGGLRIWLIHTWRPAFLGYSDSLGYLDAARLSAHGFLFANQYRPAGYSLFLSWMHALHAGLAFAIDVQHLMGLAAALMLYLAVARFSRRRWVALLPAAVVALSGSELYLEHAALSEALYTLLVIGALWCAARSYDSHGNHELVLLFTSGLLIGGSGPVRSVGVLVAPVLIGWTAATRRGWRLRLRCAAALAAGCVLTIGGYLYYQHSVTGTWGLARTTGMTLYARSAIFADCHDLTPPDGTSGLCQPPGAPRHNATWYMFDTSSPALRLFGSPPYPPSGGGYKWRPDGKLEAFAVAAVSHQPLEYLWTTVQGLVKYIDPSFGSPTMLEWSQDALIVDLHNPLVEAQAAPELAAYYPGHPVVHHSLSALDAYAKAARVEGPVTAILLVMTLAGFLLARERRRAAVGLFGWTTAMMMLAPVALLFYGARYATPSYGPLAAAAALGLDELIEHGGILKSTRSRLSRSVPTSPSPQ